MEQNLKRKKIIKAEPLVHNYRRDELIWGQCDQKRLWPAQIWKINQNQLKIRWLGKKDVCLKWIHAKNTIPWSHFSITRVQYYLSERAEFELAMKTLENIKKCGKNFTVPQNAIVGNASIDIVEDLQINDILNPRTYIANGIQEIKKLFPLVQLNLHRREDHPIVQNNYNTI